VKSVRIAGGLFGRAIKVLDADTGAPIESVEKIEITISSAGQFCRVTQLFSVASIDVETSVDEVQAKAPKVAKAPLHVPRFLPSKGGRSK
jgi:hypothetical protein